jgi:chymotrypsin
MKGLLILAFVFASAFAEIDNEIDWSSVRPIEHYPQFWEDKPADLRPPASFFEQVKQERRVNRIVGGQIATPNQFPYQAALLMFLPSIGGNALCGGTIISNQFILTAAHCVDGATNGSVILGAHFITQNEPTQQRFTVNNFNIRMDPGWDPSLIRNDVALIRLPTAAILNQFVQIADMPSGPQLTESFNGENVSEKLDDSKNFNLKLPSLY